MGIDIFSGGNSSIDRLIQTTLQVESRPRFAMEDKKSALNARNSVLSDLDSKLSSLNTLAKKFTDVLNDYFGAKSVTTSDDKIFTAVADSSAQVANHDVTISRLASSDTRVSKQFTSTGTTLRSFFDTNGSQTFQIDVAHPTTADANNRVSIGVTVNPTGSSDDSIMDEIALAINNAMSSAVTASTIDADEKLSASVVHESSGNSRLVFRSGQSGYTNRMTMTDSANSLLSTMEISNSVLSSGTSGGYITSVGTSSTDSSLNSQLSVDGLTFYRDNNVIDDVLDGVTMTLKDVTASTENMKVNVDVDEVKKRLQELLDSYNGVITFLKQNASVDKDTGKRGELAGDSTYAFLRSKLRNIMTSKVAGVSAGNPEYLSEIGITAAADGTLSFTDDDKFSAALTTSSVKVSDLFNVSDGFATQLNTMVNDYVKVGGTIDDSQSSISDRIKSVDSQISRFDERLARREIQLRKQFSHMQQVSALLGGQSAAFSSLTSSIRF